MSGIAGIKSLNISSQERALKVDRMLKSIKHRANNHHLENSLYQICLGCRYSDSSILAQNFGFDINRQLLVIMDGDVFNYVDSSPSCNSNSADAQAVLEMFICYNKEFVHKIDGSYAIAIWDGKKEELILVRDRHGTKPLFYATQKDTIIFASEIKAILETGLIERKVNLNAVDNFLSYWYVPNPNTMLQSIFQVSPGHIVTFSGDQAKDQVYWKLQYHHEESPKKEEYYKKKFYDIFLKSVSRRMAKYPDLGAFLSGGLDSSSVAAAMSQIKKKTFDVFSGGFSEKQYNEIEDARIVADHLGLNHKSIIIEFGNDFDELLKKLVWFHDTPFSDTSAIPSYFAAKLAKENVDAVLTGDFPDQILGGSGHYISALSRQRNDTALSKFLRYPFINRLILSLNLSSGSASFFDKFKRKIYRESFPIEEQRIILNMPVPELMKPCLYSKDFLLVNKANKPLSYARSLYNEVADYELLDRMLYFDTLSYAPDDLMVKVERMTMANGLIAISPFHDLELVEFVATLPWTMKINGNERKYIMRRAMEHLLPEHTMQKQKKGFDMPIDQWLIQRNPEYVKDVLLDSKTLSRGYFQKDFLTKMVTNYLDQKTDYASGSSATIISLITLELWHRLFID